MREVRLGAGSGARRAETTRWLRPVSYTHRDVYKRQFLIHAVLGVVVDKLDTVKLTGTIRIADMRGDHAGLIEIGLRGCLLYTSSIVEA